MDKFSAGEFSDSGSGFHYPEYPTDLLQDLGNQVPNDGGYHELFYNGGYGDTADHSNLSHQQRPFSAGSSSCSSAESADGGRLMLNIPPAQVYCQEDGHFQQLQCYNHQPAPPPAYTSVIVATTQQYQHPHNLNDEFVQIH